MSPSSRPGPRARKPPPPNWALDWFVTLFTQMDHAVKLLDLSTRGISVLRTVPQAIEVLAKGESPSDPEQTKKELEFANEQASLAQKELDEGFPLLHSQATVSLWADLEHAVRTLLASWLNHDGSSRSLEPVRKLKVFLGEYESLDPAERSYYILDRLELESRHRRGVERFEHLLATFGFETRLNKDVKRTLLELYHVRNVLVHRRGFADRIIVEACPWLALSVGQQVVVTEKHYRAYFDAVSHYSFTVLIRVFLRFGFSRSELTPEDLTSVAFSSAPPSVPPQDEDAESAG